MANRNGYSPLSLGHGQGDSYDQEDHYDPYSQQPPPYTISEAPSSPRLASPQGGGLQYTSPSAPPAPSSSSSTAAAAGTGAAGTSTATPRIYPQLHQQPAIVASPQSPPPQLAQSQSPYQHHHQYPQNHHQPKSPYQAIPVQENSYQYQHQQLYQQQQQQQRQPQTPQTHRPLGQGAAHFGPAPVASTPLVLARPPTRIEDLKTRPGVVVCPCCHHLVLTETSTENGSCTYIGILALFLAGITSCGCCLFPLCLTSCKDIIHSCPNCQEEVGVYSRARARTIPV